MSKALKEKLKQYLEDEDSSVRDFERKAGFQSQAIHNILSDKSKNPKLETILKIADLLDCSLDEIFERNVNRYTTLNLTSIDLNLVTNACNTILDFFKTQNLSKVPLGDFVRYIYEICEYSNKNNSGTFDKNFAEWFLKNTIKNS